MMEIDSVTKMIDLQGEQFPVVDFGAGLAVLLLHGIAEAAQIGRDHAEASCRPWRRLASA